MATRDINQLENEKFDSAGNVKTSAQGGSVASGAADSGNPIKVGGVYNSTPPSLDSGDRGDLQLDSSANTKTTLATALSRSIDSVTNYPASCTCTLVDLSTNADVVVTASPAVLLGYTVDVVMSAHDALIKDSTTTKHTVPASSAAGFDRDTRSELFATNITIESNDAATGTLAIYWRAA